MTDDTLLTLSEQDIKKLLRQLKSHKIGFYDVPEEYRLHHDIVKEERKWGIRKSDKRGYDVIHDAFFVEEIVLINDLDEMVEECINSYFPDLASYFEFLDGDIYENACYYQYNFSQKEIDTYNIDMNKINTIAFIDYTIKDFSVELSDEELQQYKQKEKDKGLYQKWIDKLNACNTYEELSNIINGFKESEFYTMPHDLYPLIYTYVLTNRDKAFDIIMKFVSDGGVYLDFVCGLCSIYDPAKVYETYDYSRGSKQKIRKNRNAVKKYIEYLRNTEVKYEYKSFFDEKTHFYCYQTTVKVYTNEYIQSFDINRVITNKINRYFNTLQELTDFLENDLSGCDLSKAILPDIDFSIYKIDGKTKLPIQNLDDLTYSLYKGYDGEEDCFIVKQSWLGVNGQLIKEHIETFEYFFDFLFFLNNDLSDADLLSCEGLDNLNDFSKLNLTNTKLRSNILDRLGKKYSLCSIDTSKIEDFTAIMKNEEETDLALLSKREDYFSIEEILNHQKVYYVSDLHILHKLHNSACKSHDDILCIVQQIVNNLLKRCGNILLIGGDTCSDFQLFALFTKLLRQTLDERKREISVVFILGNHELWDFPNCSFEEIVQKYRDMINAHNMYLLQNDIIFMDIADKIHRITTNEILTSSWKSIREQLISAKLILFGGIAFSGYNKKFNATHGIYRSTISRKQEIAESKKFEKLYNIVQKNLSDKRVIIFTHTPQKDWNSNNAPHSGYIYVSGHTHRNYYDDDGEYRIYADNQIGYKRKNSYPKYFYVDTEYDLFSEYDDGIYEITREQYIDFYRGKKIGMQFARDVHILYMLKKNGYYCFIHESPKGKLAILNGGVLKNLNINNISYYYDRMDDVVVYIKKPLDKFTSVQKKIANEIKAIGGSGTIHGAIIDIDFHNHIYVNPYDLTIVGYWASDMIDKKVFPSIPKLLENNCPSLYNNYLKRLNGKVETELVIISDSKQGKAIRTYLGTDIYRASREIKKMQKLGSNILSEWYEPSKKMLE